MSHNCRDEIPESTLMAYWLGETAAPESAAIEEHVFGCAGCSARLQKLVELGAAIRRATIDGAVHAVLSPSFVRQLQQDGLRVREYRMQPGTSVACTIAPEDDLVVSHLHAPFGDVRQVDVIFEDPETGSQVRMRDVAFDTTAEEVVLVPSARELRRLGVATRRARLLAVQDGAERELGSYTFNHSPHGA